MRLVRRTLLALAATTMLTAPAFAADAIKIGLSGPFTGGSASMGVSMRDGVRLAVEEINKAIIDASNGALKGILGSYTEPLVSSDFNHDPRSSVFALNETKVMEGTFVRVMSWYDNEWGFSNRMADTAVAMMGAK